ncbi:hypothetical protein WJ70_01120 [Burkholderia ubonensis]|nr:hypothetical protein WJ70_01120 [Burkholderia ubonensis]
MCARTQPADAQQHDHPHAGAVPFDAFDADLARSAACAFPLRFAPRVADPATGFPKQVADQPDE